MSVDSINVAMDKGGNTEEDQATHDAKMAQLADEQATRISSRDSRTDESVELEAQQGDPEVTARPDDVPEKFWDAEKGEVNVAALLKAQQDGESALRKAQNKPAESTEESPEAAPEAADSQQDAIAAASAEWADSGELSEDTFEALEKVGLSKSMVNDYIEGQQAIVDSLQNAAFGEFDGEAENYKAAVEWARDNLDEAEIQALDLQLTSRQPGVVRQGAASLAQKFAANSDMAPQKTVVGQGNAANTGAHFKSGAEMKAAMRDSRYKNDPAFRAEVANKIAAADRFGVNLFN